MLEAAGADRVLTMDLHAGQVQGFFHVPVDHMTALMMLTQYFDDLGLQDLVVVAPDAGRVKLNKKFASKIGAELAILDKERPAQQVAEIGYVIGDVKGRTAIIVDDMIDTAGTLRAAAQTVARRGRLARLRRRDARDPLGQRLREPRRARRFEQIVVTDTIPLRAGRAGQHPRPQLRRAADRLDPPDLHRRLGLRGLRRREPALLTSTAAPLLMERLGLTEDELCRVLDADPLTVIAGELDHRPELPILLALTEEAAERVGAGGPAPLGAAAGPAGRPLDHLLARDFAAFEDDLDGARRARLRRCAAEAPGLARPPRRPASSPGASRPGQTPVR